MSEVRQQVLIEASPKVVWALITDVNRHPEWWPDVEAVHRGLKPPDQLADSE